MNPPPLPLRSFSEIHPFWWAEASLTTKINLFVWSDVSLTVRPLLCVVGCCPDPTGRQVSLSEISVQGDGKPLGEGLLGAVLKSGGHGPLDGRHQREASAWIHGQCFHKQQSPSLAYLVDHYIIKSFESSLR